MRQDSLGNPVSCDAEVLRYVDDFADGLLRYHPRAVHVLSVIDRLDQSLPNICAGYLWMFLERPEAPAKARPYLDRAEAGLAHANDRERAHAGLLRAWLTGDIPGAAARAEAITAAWPRDLMALKIAQYHHLNMGDSPGILASGLRLRAANRGNAQIEGMIAFGFEQCHLLDDAADAAGRALAIEPGEPWAHHALAHVLLTRGQHRAGIGFLTGASPAWEGLNSFITTHNWWHMALFRLGLGDGAAALSLYDTRCWGIEPDYSQDQIGAVSLLARLECAGVDVGPRWASLCPYLESRAEDTGNAFLSLQYLYGLARAGSPAADRLLQALAGRAAEAAPWEREMWAATGLPAAHGVLAHARGEYPKAIRYLSAVLATLGEVGGSHAQRDLFHQLLLDALIRDRRWTAAQQMLETRRVHDPAGVPLNLMLARVYAELGLPDQAAEARARAQ